jgi:hypothetical protein
MKIALFRIDFHHLKPLRNLYVYEIDKTTKVIQMPIKDIFKQISDPLRHMVLNSPIRGIFSQHIATITFIERQSGITISISADHFRDKDTIYMIGDKDEKRWLNLSNGASVIIFISGIRYTGWAELLMDPKGIGKIIMAHPDAQSLLEQEYKIQEISGDTGDGAELKNFIENHVLIKVKLSR